MRFIQLGSSGIEVSVIGLGTWVMGGWFWGGSDTDESIRAIHASLEKGINLIDTAPGYGKEGLAERIIGKALKCKREKVVIATKCGLVWHKKHGQEFFKYDGYSIYRHLGKESIKYEIEKSLQRLKTDYIDLYQTHWPDPATHTEETMEALLDLKKEGKIRAIGVCNTSIEEIKQYKAIGQVDTNQEKYNILERRVEKDYLPWCQENNVTFMSYGSLCQGLLTGKIKPSRKFKSDDVRGNDLRFSKDGIKKINSLLNKFLKPIADSYNISLGQLATAWLTSKEGVVALCGARNTKQAAENANAGETVLSENDNKVIQDFVGKYEDLFE